MKVLSICLFLIVLQINAMQENGLELKEVPQKNAESTSLDLTMDKFFKIIEKGKAEKFEQLLESHKIEMTDYHHTVLNYAITASLTKHQRLENKTIKTRLGLTAAAAGFFGYTFAHVLLNIYRGDALDSLSFPCDDEYRANAYLSTTDFLNETMPIFFGIFGGMSLLANCFFMDDINNSTVGQRIIGLKAMQEILQKNIQSTPVELEKKDEIKT